MSPQNTTATPARRTRKPLAAATSAAETAAFHRALSGLLRVYQFRDRERICCYDVSVTQCYALEVLVNEGPLTVNEVAAALYLDKSTASRVADALEQKGYAVRDANPESRRSVLLEATASGRELYGRIERNILAQEERLLSEFTPEVRRSMTRVIEGLTQVAAACVDTSGGSCCSVEPPLVGLGKSAK